MNKKQLIYNFFKNQDLMVLATTNQNGNPSAAVVDFTALEDLSLIFCTYTKTKKYTNILHNPHVAIVFGNESWITVQYEGIATVLKEEELDRYKAIYLSEHPSSQIYDTKAYLKVVPTWIRYFDEYTA